MDLSAFSLLIAALLGGSGIGAVAVLRKAKAESENIAAKTLIEVNAELRKELARRDAEIKRQYDEIVRLRGEISNLQTKLSAVQKDLGTLERQFLRLSGEVK